jgi:predicted Fe-S protein YdhL (DUF1289 family)
MQWARCIGQRRLKPTISRGPERELQEQRGNYVDMPDAPQTHVMRLPQTRNVRQQRRLLWGSLHGQEYGDQ